MTSPAVGLPSRSTAAALSKRAFLKAHKICGLAAALFIFLQASTGALLAFRWQVAQVIDPGGMLRHSVSVDAPLGDIVSVLARSAPAYEVTRIIFPVVRNGTYLAYLASSDGKALYASIDPGDSTVLRQGDLWSFPTELILRVHESLSLGDAGALAVAVIGAAILIMIGTGLFYWWPRAGRWSRSLSVNPRLPMRLVLRQLHRSAAVPISMLFGLSALTGAYLAVALYIEGGDVVPKVEMPIQQPAMGAINRAMTVAQAAFPGRGIRDVRFPSPSSLQVYFWAPERNPRAVHFVEIDMRRARITAERLAQNDNGLWVFPLPIHTGESFGLGGRIALLAGAVTLLLLSGSGVVMWMQARPKARR
jgi:uncharacterized iron-regulated membrane protein